ncbi:MAG: ChbG/HpnK family deacetylase, partial [Candidatus Aureabacteria bacterium]|nr:ChbG/HpnK family deacetylase [Candidatus Auribacterota bacterium]
VMCVCTQHLEGRVKRLIINADDFGMTGSVNRAILKGFREGVLTSATIMVNGPSYAEAVGISRENPGLGVGVHLNILRGRPVLPPKRIPSLVGPDGLFLRSTALLLRRFLRGRLNPREITEELSAQIGKALSDGISVSHIDSEKHLHTLFIRPAIEAALSNGISKIRLSRECAPFSPRGLLNKRFYASLVIRAYASRARRLLAARGISHPDHFFGIQGHGEMLPRCLERLIAALPEGTSEIMTHPGRGGIMLISYRDL